MHLVFLIIFFYFLLKSVTQRELGGERLGCLISIIFGVISLGSYAVFNKWTFFQEKEKQDALKVKQEKEELLKKADSQSCIEAQR